MDAAFSHIALEADAVPARSADLANMHLTNQQARHNVGVAQKPQPIPPAKTIDAVLDSIDLIRRLVDHRQEPPRLFRGPLQTHHRRRPRCDAARTV